MGIFMNNANDGRRCDELLSESIWAIGRRIRTIRGTSGDWSLRTSELLSTTLRRVLVASEEGSMELPRDRFFGLVNAVVRGAIVDRIRRLTVHRKAVRILQQRCASAHAMENSHEPSSSATSVQNPLECNEEAQALLASMTESDRELISARMACETWQQAADRLGISVDLARQRWRNLRMRMQRSTV